MNEVAEGRSVLRPVSQSFEEVEGCGCDPWSYTATLAWRAKLNTNTHAKSSKMRQNTGFKGRSGDVRGGISIVNYT
jgi:hypothetical protein